MLTVLIALHVIVCVAMIMIVLLQTGKGADMGAAFGGGSSQTLFGSTGASTFLSKATTGAAVVFMLTSLSLAYFYGHQSQSTSIVTETAVPAPATQTIPAEAETAAPSTGTAPDENAVQETSAE
jgi:preprotein translocase subunit SecG